MKKLVKIILGCFVFGLGLDLFLIPNGINAGGISGLSMALVHLTGFGSVGVLTMTINLPLFALAGVKLGKDFFKLSLFGTAVSAVLIDLIAFLPYPKTEPLVGCLYGGLLCGLGLGMVFAVGGSTGGSDIIVRLLKRKFAQIPLGNIVVMFDLLVALLTGIVFRDVGRTLYSMIAIVLVGRIIDAVVYRFDYSRVVLIISPKSQLIARCSGNKLGRGATFLYGRGSVSGAELQVVLSAIRRQQLTELKKLVTAVDPNAFVIVQEAHQVLGDGFHSELL